MGYYSWIKYNQPLDRVCFSKANFNVIVQGWAKRIATIEMCRENCGINKCREGYIEKRSGIESRMCRIECLDSRAILQYSDETITPIIYKIPTELPTTTENITTTTTLYEYKYDPTYQPTYGYTTTTTTTTE